MIRGVGIDIIKINRMRETIKKSDGEFLSMIFTENEIAYCNSRRYIFQHFATRFAGKEALLKALGIGWQKGIKWTDVEIINDKLGKPEVILHGKAKELYDFMNINSIFLTLSHCDEYAVAQVILET